LRRQRIEQRVSAAQAGKVNQLDAVQERHGGAALPPKNVDVVSTAQRKLVSAEAGDDEFAEVRLAGGHGRSKAETVMLQV
jgi:hypothetical protein